MENIGESVLHDISLYFLLTSLGHPKINLILLEGRVLRVLELKDAFMAENLKLGPWGFDCSMGGLWNIQP